MHTIRRIALPLSTAAVSSLIYPRIVHADYKFKSQPNCSRNDTIAEIKRLNEEDKKKLTDKLRADLMKHFPSQFKYSQYGCEISRKIRRALR
jgi:hypothetical protein